MVCTYTNIAVDNLVEGLLAAGLKPLRSGTLENTRPSLIEHTLEYQFGRHRLKPEHDELVEQLKKTSNDILDARHLFQKQEGKGSQAKIG